MIKIFLKVIDNALIKLFSIHYMAFSRDQFSHDRFIFGKMVIKKYFKNSNLIEIADIGCGSCNFFEYLRNSKLKFNYTGYDFDTKKLEKKNKFKNADNLKIIEIDLKKIEVKNIQYDIVWCSEVIEHILDHENFFKNLFNICKPGGIIILTAPNLNNMKKYSNFKIMRMISKIEDGGHVRLGYNIVDIKNLYKKFNLEMKNFYFLSKCNSLRIIGRYYYKNEFFFIIFNFLCALKILYYKKFLKYEMDNEMNYNQYHSIAVVLKKN